MLIRFTLKNWMSFRDEATFSMIASKERQHGGRVPALKKYRTRILPVAAIYGGNASGKTNLFQALSFAKYFVVRGSGTDDKIPVVPFLLDDQSASADSRFCFEIFVNECVYEFSFSITSSKVQEEKLVRILPSSEKVLYHRRGSELVECDSCDKEPRLQFAFQGTRDNQLFLTNSVSQKLDKFRDIYDWFKYSLVIVGPDSRFGSFEQFLDEASPLYGKMNALLRQLDTGIDHVGGETVPFENMPISSSVKDAIRSELKEGESIRFPIDGERRFVVTRKDGKIFAKQLVSFHQTQSGEKVKFDIENESDGSKRTIDLLPAFLDLLRPESKRVYAIDELDRSLHSSLTRALIEMYLEGVSEETRAQLLMTTHDVLLMDQNLLRRDEMWATERDGNGVSSLCSLCEFEEVRYDKDLRKSYLQGRLGGVPKIFLTKAIGNEV